MLYLASDFPESITSISRIRVADRKNSSHSNPQYYSQEKKKEQSEEDQYLDDQHEELCNDYTYDIELASLIMEKKNLEFALFAESDKESNLIKNKIAEIEKKIIELKTSSERNKNESGLIMIDEQIEKLMLLNIQYDKYLEMTNKESEAIENQESDNLEIIMEHKRLMLNELDKIRTSINFDILANESENNSKRVKGNQIISDIKMKIKKIIDVENKNSVELQNQKEEMKLELGKRNTGTRAIAKYAAVEKRSHFINTKK